MSLAVLSLLLLQFYWIRNAHHITEKRFEENVKKSLQRTVEDLEKLEALQFLSPEEYYEEIVMSEFGDIMQAQESIQVRDTVIFQDGEPFQYLVVSGTTLDTATGLQTHQRVITKNLGQIITTEIDNAVVGIRDTNEFAIQLNRSFQRQIWNKARYLNEMMRKMFTSNFFDDITFRLNVYTLDSLLTRNLKSFSTDTAFSFNILDTRTGKIVQFADSSKHLDLAMEKGDYKATLYPSDDIPSNYQLVLSFPGQSYYLWKEMLGTLIGSFLLVLIIIFAFYFAVSTIVRQKKLSEIKNDFVSNMTHELKTPISTISLACEAIRDPDVSNNTASLNNFVRMIEQENKRLGKLVENVLQTALIDKGKLKLNLQKESVNQLVKEVVDAFQIRFQNQGGKIYIKRLDEIQYEVDKIHFGNVIYNLLDNALKYNKNTPEVNIKLIRNNGGFILEIKDNGIGIRKEDQKRIFEKLFRLPTGDVHDVKGFGLGLSYVYSIVKLHKGEIVLKSTPGEGSTFKILMP